MLTLADVPLSILNRALSLYDEPREKTAKHAWTALLSVESRKDIKQDFPGITPLAQAVAEYISLSGPWNDDDGEYAGESGYQVELEG